MRIDLTYTIIQAFFYLHLEVNMYRVAARKLRPGEDKYAGTISRRKNTDVLMPLEWYKARGEEKDYDDTGFVPYG